MTFSSSRVQEPIELNYDFWDRTALVVEPDAEVRSHVRRAIAEHGMTVFEAASSVEALELLADEFFEPELLIQDVKVADMVGLHLAQTMRSIRPGLPIVFLSSYLDEQMVGVGFQQQGWSLLAKPFSAPDLLAHCVAALEKPQA